MKLSREAFGKYKGKTVWRYTLANDQGVRVQVMSYGATLTRIDVPDRYGVFRNIVLGCPSFEGYLMQHAYLGATVGRVAGRIAEGQFTIDGQDYQLVRNNGRHTNHGGPNNFSKQLWESESLETKKERVGVRFSLNSPDGFNGFPGNLAVTVTYTLNNNNEWGLHYQAETDRATLFNPTNHVYFNLSGDYSKTIDHDVLELNSSRYGSVQEDGLPTGELIDVAETVFDFTGGAPFSRGFLSDDPQLRLVGGYDHPFMLDDSDKTAAILKNKESGIQVSLKTTNNAVVVYTGNGFATDLQGIRPHAAVTLEAQMMPDAIHHSGFGNIILRPGETHQSEAIYQFSVYE